MRVGAAAATAVVLLIAFAGEAASPARAVHSCSAAGADEQQARRHEQARTLVERLLNELGSAVEVDAALRADVTLDENERRDALDGLDELRRDGRALFDGATLAGWHPVGGGRWSVEDGVIVGRSAPEEPRHGLLVSDGVFADFEVTFEYLVHEGDSGFYFRVEPVGGALGVRGFQVEVDDAEPGGLYETGGRAWVIKPAPGEAQAWHRRGAWNQVTLRAVGPGVKVTVNGTVTAELDDPDGNRRGHFALQLHGGQAMHVRYRNIRLRYR
jgi:hypothetical protein